MRYIKKILIISFLLFPVLNPGSLFAREFLNTYLHINFVFMYSLSTFGEITDVEHDSFGIPDPDNNNKTARPDHHDEAYGMVLDITPIPSFIIGMEEHAVKIGFRVGYRFHSLQQETALENSSYGGDLLTFRTLMYGPVIYYAPSIEPSRVDHNYNASKGFVFYALFGKLSKGYLKAFPSFRDYYSRQYYKDNPGEALAAPDYIGSPVTGYKIDIGVGGEVSICGSVNIGLNLYYSRIRLKTKHSQIYTYSNPNISNLPLSRELGSKTTLHEICAELYIGIPVQYW